MKKGIFTLSLVVMLPSLLFAQIKWQKNTDGITFDQVKAMAKAQNKQIFIDFYTKWCGPCRSMDKNVFSTQKIGDFYHKNFIPFKVDAEVGEGIELREKYNVQGYPTYTFTDVEGNVLEEGTSVGYGNVDGMIRLAKMALGDKEIKDWAWYQEEYENGNREADFLSEYMEQRMAATSMPPTTQLRLEWVKAHDEKTRFTNEDVRLTIFWQSVPGNEFYEMVKANKDKYPELKDKRKKISWVSSALVNAKFDPDSEVSEEEIKSAIKQDFPLYTDLAIEFVEIDAMRFDPEAPAKSYVDAFFGFINKHDLPVDMNPYISFSLLDMEKVKKSYAAAVFPSLEEGINDDPPHYFSCYTYAAILYKSGDKKKAQEMAIKYKDLTESFKDSKKMEAVYVSMKAMEKGDAPGKLRQ